jgi:multicomponent Na+:H+ antiporter subunit D
MEVIYSAAPLYAVLASLCAIPLIYLSDRKPDLRESWTLIAASLKFVVILTMVPHILQGKVIYFKLATFLPGIDLAFRVDALGLFFALTASLLWIVTSFYSIGYVRSLSEQGQTRFFMCFAGSLSATIGAAFAANLFTLYVFYEALTLITYPLVAHAQTTEAYRGAKIYLTYLLATSIAFLLPAIIITYFITGTTDFSAGGVFGGDLGVNPCVYGMLFALFIAGVAKAGMMPFHSWLPSAMVAPTPVSSLLHAVAVVKMGVFTVLRIVFYIFGVDLLKDIGAGAVLAVSASFTIIAASVIALRKDNIKAMLAYSTVAQLSYIILGAALLTPAAAKASIMHIGIHAFSKISLFFWAGAVYVALKKKYISELNGISKLMPISTAVFVVGALSLIGVPMFSGFISKFYLLSGAWEAEQYGFMVVLCISSFMNALYFVPIMYSAYMKSPAEGTEIKVQEAPAVMLVPMCITAFVAVALFFLPGLLSSFADLTVNSIFISAGGQ